MTRINRNYLVT